MTMSNALKHLHHVHAACALAATLMLVGCASQSQSQDGSPDGNVAKHKVGAGGRAVWVFTPNAPRPASAPVIVFLHGYRATNPYSYGGWIDHLVRQGNIVLFPIYEEGRDDAIEDIQRNLVSGVREGLKYVQQSGSVRPDLSRVAFVGHSFGGGLAAQLAARAQGEGLPQPKAVMMVQPGWRGNDAYPESPLANVPSSVLMLVVDGSNDQFASSRKGRSIFVGARNVPNSRKGHIVLQSGPGLIADHYAPLSPHPDYQLEQKTGGAALRERIVKKAMDIRDGETDDLDRNGFWRLFDALKTAAFRGEKDVGRAIADAGGENLGPVRAKLLRVD